MAENISCLLYPSSKDSTENREIRLKQEYFLCAASLSDIIRRFKASKLFQATGCRADFRKFAEKNAIHLNDASTTLCIPELMRVLIDIENMSWDEAWAVVSTTFSLTIHSDFPDALEKWPITLLEKLLPRHVELILQINFQHLETAKKMFSVDADQAFGLTFLCGADLRDIDMIRLGIVGSNSVTSASAMQASTMQGQTFKALYELQPSKFGDITNGVSPRRWLLQCNPGLTDVICDSIGEKWPQHAEKLESLDKFSRNFSLQSAVEKAKQGNKLKVSKVFEKLCGVTVDPSSLFDVQAQRVTKSKRQLLNCLHIVTLFNRIKLEPTLAVTPRTFIFSGKVEPGDHFGKEMIKLIVAIASYVNNDPIIGDKLKVLFVENYGVSLAELLIPCADLSQQISLTGSGANGVSSIKMMMNGALTICTRDGVVNQIANEVGEENIFVFGSSAEDVEKGRAKPLNAKDILTRNSELKKCVDQIRNGYFCPQNPNEFRGIVEDVLKSDEHCVLADYEDYIRAQSSVSKAFQVRHEVVQN